MSRKKHKITIEDGSIKFSRHSKRIVFTEDLGSFKIYVFEATSGLYSTCLSFYPNLPWSDGKPAWIFHAARMKPSIEMAIQETKEKWNLCDPNTKSSLKH